MASSDAAFLGQASPCSRPSRASSPPPPRAPTGRWLATTAGARGAADGKGNIQMPVVGWKSYLGGRLAADGLLTADVEGNGKNAFVIAAGGSVSAVRPDGTVMWSTPTSGTAHLMGLFDLDGDGKQEVVAFTSLRAMAIDLASGAVAWAEPAGEMGVLSDVRVGDMTGDGLPELVVEEGRGANGYKTADGVRLLVRARVRERHGVPPSPVPADRRRPAERPRRHGREGGRRGLILGVDPTTHMADLLSLVGTSGNIEASTQPLGHFPSGCIPAGDLAGSPGDEVVCFIPSTTGMPGPGDTSEVFAVTLKSGALQKLVVGHPRVAEPDDHERRRRPGGGPRRRRAHGDRHRGPRRQLRTPSTSSTRRTSAPSARRSPGSSSWRRRPALKGGARVIITTSDERGRVLGVRQGSGDGPRDDRRRRASWSAERLGALRPSRARGPSAPSRFDVNGDGAPRHRHGRQPDRATSTPTRPAWTRPCPRDGLPSPDTPLTGIWPMPAMDRPYPQIAVTATDGGLRLLDKTLASLPRTSASGGYYLQQRLRRARPVSRGGLARRARPSRSWPSTAADARPARRLVREDRHGQLPSRYGRAADRPLPSSYPGSTAPRQASSRCTSSTRPRARGSTRCGGSTRTAPWSWEVPDPAGTPAQDHPRRHFDGSGVPDLACRPARAPAAFTTFAISGADGHTLWSKSTMVGCQIPDSGDVHRRLERRRRGRHHPPVGTATYIPPGVDGSQLARAGRATATASPSPSPTRQQGKEASPTRPPASP